MIRFEKIYVKFVNEFYSIFNANFSIDSNTILIEKNPCGCTAFFRILTKIQTSYQGDVFIENVNLKSINKKDLDISFLPENPILFNNKSLKYNLEFPLKIRKINKKTRKNIVNSLFLHYNLDKFNKKTKKISLSEKKIIALLRAFIRKPKYILIENLFENLDEKYINLTCDILEEMKKYSTLIVCEKSIENLVYFKDFLSIEI